MLFYHLAILNLLTQYVTVTDICFGISKELTLYLVYQGYWGLKQGCIKFPISPLLGRGKVIKSVGEEYQVGKSEREYHVQWEEYNGKKGKAEAISFSLLS